MRNLLSWISKYRMLLYGYQFGFRPIATNIGSSFGDCMTELSDSRTNYKRNSTQVGSGRSHAVSRKVCRNESVRQLLLRRKLVLNDHVLQPQITSDRRAESADG